MQKFFLTHGLNMIKAFAKYQEKGGGVHKVEKGKEAILEIWQGESDEKHI